MIVADTSVLIDFLNKREPHHSRVRDLIQSGRLATTVITRFELLVGARASTEKPIRELLAELPCRGLDAGIADRAGEIGNELERMGRRIGLADTLIAAIVIESGDSLFTGNLDHFQRVEGLQIA